MYIKKPPYTNNIAVLHVYNKTTCLVYIEYIQNGMIPAKVYVRVQYMFITHCP